MISFPFRRPSQGSTIRALYGMIVTQARSPEFYRSYGVPDTVTGRMDMIVLHLVLVLRRLREGSVKLPQAGQELFDLFCQDMDHNFREMGVGDLKVPKEMRRVAEAFYGRARVYDAALDVKDTGALATALARNVFGASEPTLGASRLAAYMSEAAAMLAEQEAGASAEPGFRFPAPETTSSGLVQAETRQ